MHRLMFQWCIHLYTMCTMINYNLHMIPALKTKLDCKHVELALLGQKSRIQAGLAWAVHQDRLRGFWIRTLLGEPS